MSSKGIYTALSGAMAQTHKLDTIANNLANVDTAAFKKDKQTFNEYLTANEKYPDTLQVPRVTASIESFYDMQGGDKSFVDTNGTYTDFSQGGLKQTGNAFDFALEGRGFFEVQTPNGVRLQRAGHFKISPEGFLVTNNGHPVLAEGIGVDPEQRRMQLAGSGNVTVAFNGEIYQDGGLVGKMSIVDPQNQEALQKQGQLLYGFKDNQDPQLQLATGARVHQGYVETSNVNVVEEMTEMIKTTRAFESTQKAIRAFDEMDNKLVNEVGRVR